MNSTCVRPYRLRTRKAVAPGRKPQKPTKKATIAAATTTRIRACRPALAPRCACCCGGGAWPSSARSSPSSPVGRPRGRFRPATCCCWKAGSGDRGAKPSSSIPVLVVGVEVEMCDQSSCVMAQLGMTIWVSAPTFGRRVSLPLQQHRRPTKSRGSKSQQAIDRIREALIETLRCSMQSIHAWDGLGSCGLVSWRK